MAITSWLVVGWGRAAWGVTSSATMAMGLLQCGQPWTATGGGSGCERSAGVVAGADRWRRRQAACRQLVEQ
jgi:hypothetical protein